MPVFYVLNVRFRRRNTKVFRRLLDTALVERRKRERRVASKSFRRCALNIRFGC
jgi:hypothetical protein